MKFKIRYADQIVGLFTIGAAVAVVAAVFLIGSNQRWFAKDYHFSTMFDSASGVKAGMEIQYKGFTVGKVESVSLNKVMQKDTVEVHFYIYDTYYSWVHEGSVVELNVSPIGLGNQFLFYPGNGEALIPDNSFIPRIDSPEGKANIEKNLVVVPKKDDTISNLISQANNLLITINSVLDNVDNAFAGRGDAPLANTLRSVEQATANVSGITQTLNSDLAEITGNIQEITAALSKAANSPSGAVPALIDPNGTIFAGINETIAHTSGTIANLEKATATLPSQFPQLAGTVSELQTTLQSAQDVLEALKNNPLLKKGVPERVNTDTSGTSPRNIDF